MGRFLNADVVYDTDAGLQSYNLFAYCGSNPINRIDISGTDSERLDDLDLDDDEVTERGGGGRGDRGHYRGGNGTNNSNGTNGSAINTYQPPSGGGGTTNTITVHDTTVTFGHGGRHLSGTSLSTSEVETAIAYDVVNQPVSSTKSQAYGIVVGYTCIEYRAIMRSMHHIHVGTYYLK